MVSANTSTTIEQERERHGLEKQLALQEEEIRRLNADIASKDAVVGELRRQANDFQADRRMRSEETLRRELSCLHSEIDEKRKAVDSLQLATDAGHTIAEIRAENTRLQKELTRSEESTRHMENLKNESHRQIEVLKTECSRQVETLRTECVTLRQHNATLAHGLQAEVSAKVRESETRLIQQQQRTEDHHQQETAALRESLRQKEEELRDYTASCAAKQKDIDVLTSQVHEMKGHGERLHSLLYQASEDGNITRDALREEQRKHSVIIESIRTELSAKMQTDLSRVVQGAEVELAAVRERCKQYESKYRRTKERLVQAEARERTIVSQLNASAEGTSAERAREHEDFKQREGDVLAAAADEREALTLRLSKAENELYTTRAALAEAKTQALVQYFNERGFMEHEMSSKVDIISEEVKSCVKLVRRMLEKHTSQVEPPPGEADSRLITLKQLVWVYLGEILNKRERERERETKYFTTQLLLLQSHTSLAVEDPPQTAACLMAWQERGKELLGAKVWVFFCFSARGIISPFSKKKKSFSPHSKPLTACLTKLHK